jgi:hypothetical protein
VTFRERLGAANRLQRSRVFKIVATIVIAIAAIATVSTYVVRQTVPGGLEQAQTAVPDARPDEEDLTEEDRAYLSALEAGQRAIEDVFRAQADWKSVAFGAGAVAAMSIAVVWLGLGLTYLVLLAAAGAVGYPLLRFEATATVGQVFLGIVSLTASFAALLQLARMLLSHPGPVSSIARVVLDEAVRMKISLVFIVILIIGLSALPNALDADQPLRYRVQSFMSFSTGLSFWTIAVLTLLFAAATVTFEQRDKIIWQTMTKPVSAAKYILGKWLGVCAINAILLTVCASGIFLFVEYLRDQPALGERAAFVSGMGGGALTEDRWLLETQVLTSRVSVYNEEPFTRSTPAFLEGAEQFIRDRQALDERFAATGAERAKIIDDLYTGAITEYRSIEPGNSERYIFRGLGKARGRGVLLNFRHRIDAGSNRPDEFYEVTFEFTDGSRLIQRMSGGYWHSARVYPTAIYEVTDKMLAETEPDRRGALRDLDGALVVQVINADVETGLVNRDTITFPPEGLEISYPVGSYRLNFVRAMIVLWAKLAFLAIVAIWASTFLSFPVACVVAFGVFLAAEGSGYLRQSLESFATTNQQGQVQIFNLIAASVTRVVAGAFSLYADLRPTKRLVQGQLIPVSSVLSGAAFIAAASAALYLAAVVTFRRRELATYSGR